MDIQNLFWVGLLPYGLLIIIAVVRCKQGAPIQLLLQWNELYVVQDGYTVVEQYKLIIKSSRDNVKMFITTDKEWEFMMDDIEWAWPILEDLKTYMYRTVLFALTYLNDSYKDAFMEVCAPVFKEVSTILTNILTGYESWEDYIDFVTVVNTFYEEK